MSSFFQISITPSNILEGIATDVSKNVSSIEEMFSLTFCPSSSRRQKKPKIKPHKAKMTLGDIKTGLQPEDHGNWIKLDGRLKSTLLPFFQLQATTLGLGINIPDASNSSLIQNGETLGSTTGSNSTPITRSHLPNVTLSGTTTSDGIHTHPTTTAMGGSHSHTGSTTISGNHGHIVHGSRGHDDGNHSNVNEFALGDVGYNHDVSTNPSGNHTHGLIIDNSTEHTHDCTINDSTPHTHDFTTTSINGNVTQIALDTTPQSMSVNTFVYLGLD